MLRLGARPLAALGASMAHGRFNALSVLHQHAVGSRSFFWSRNKGGGGAEGGGGAGGGAGENGEGGDGGNGKKKGEGKERGAAAAVEEASPANELIVPDQGSAVEHMPLGEWR
jgi:hypothetical protein